MSEIVRHAIETKSKIKQELVLKQQDFLLNEVCNYCGFSNMYSETPQKPFQDETKFWFKGNIYIGKSRFGTAGHVWYRGDGVKRDFSVHQLIQPIICICSKEIKQEWLIDPKWVFLHVSIRYIESIACSCYQMLSPKELCLMIAFRINMLYSTLIFQ